MDVDDERQNPVFAAASTVRSTLTSPKTLSVSNSVSEDLTRRPDFPAHICAGNDE